MEPSRGALASLTAVRTVLFVPADDLRKCQKAWTAGADAVILDLEDGVAPEAKRRARATLRRALAARKSSSAAVVRINALDSSGGVDDLGVLAELNVDAIMVPKADPEGVRLAARSRVPLIPLVETAAGVLAAEEVAREPGVALLAFGPVDLAAEIRCERTATGHELLFAQSRIVLASAAAGLPAPIDGPCLRVDDVEGLRAEATSARQLGFGGKACIHPLQVESVRRVFTPSPEDVAWATTVVTAYEAARERGRGVVSMQGQMIDLPVAKRAYGILAKAEA